MSLKLPGQWVWDSWYAFDGEQHHAFYLQASRALQNPHRRHLNPSVGHAVSTDLKNWTVVADAIYPSQDDADWDSWTTWTGSVVQDDNGLWWMFYTGNSRATDCKVQTIGAATSKDLMTWTKVEGNPLVTADPRWYAKYIPGGERSEDFRDPWVFRFPDDQSTWHMLMTARDKNGPSRQDAIMGHATSKNLIDWEMQPPLSIGGQGFGETEVFQFEIVDGVPIVLYCCGPIWLSEARLAAGEIGGIYSLPVSADLSDVDFNRAVLFDGPTPGYENAKVKPNPALYASRLVKDTAGGWNLIAFRNETLDGEFIGELTDPIPVTADPSKGLIRR
ncbi:MAG: glycosyl hydrolase family 32 [Micrococcales bacterium]